MTQIFDEDGRWVPVTVLQAGPCTVLQVKTPERDGYSAVQLGFDDRRKKMKRPQQALLERWGVSAKGYIREVPYIDAADVFRPGESGVGSDDAGESEGSEGEAAEALGIEPGVQIDVRALSGVARVDVQGLTKGRGFTGTIKRYGFHAGDKSHGSKNIREPGSTGMHTDPGRIFKGKKMPGHHGHAKRKARNLSVVHIDEEKSLLLVRGAVPGPNGAYIYIEESL